MWSFFSSFGHSFWLFGKLALFINASFERLPQLNFGIARGLASLVQSCFGRFSFRFEFYENVFSKLTGF
ncbi:hypothetical protein BOO21_20120 [Vibrio cidicii]|nr:hypothetical protein [Vibrio cidicii]